MNKLENKSTIGMLKEKGWQFGIIGIINERCWSKEGICVREQDIWFEELEKELREKEE